jgi:hypothetical protein
MSILWQIPQMPTLKLKQDGAWEMVCPSKRERASGF